MAGKNTERMGLREKISERKEREGRVRGTRETDRGGR